MITAEELELEQDIAGFELNPLGYVRYAFPWGEPGTDLANVSGPRTWQAEVLQFIGDQLQAGVTPGEAVLGAIQIARSSGHGIGKGALISMITLWGLSTFEDTKIVITANTERQLQTKTSPELSKWHRLAINSHWFDFQVTSLKSADPAHANTWRADLIPWSENNTEAFAGLHNKGKRLALLMDESSAIADKVWEVAEGAMTDAETQIIWCAFGNPTRNTGRFRECFRRFKHRWNHKQIDAREVEGINLAQTAKWVEDYGEESDFVKIRVRGLFPAASAKQFISQDDVDAAYGRHIREEQYRFAPKILTVDPAWDGGDEFCVGLRQGLVFKMLRTIQKNDDDVAMADMIARIEDDEGADAVFIDGGYGTGIVSVGRTLGRTWIIVWFGGASADPGCVNKRAEMANSTKTWLKEGGCLPKDPILQAQLTSIETVPRLDGKVLLEPKEIMKKRGLDSPGRADALFLSFAHPVAKRDSATRSGRGRVVSEYDPLNEEHEPQPRRGRVTVESERDYS